MIHPSPDIEQAESQALAFMRHRTSAERELTKQLPSLMDDCAFILIDITYQHCSKPFWFTFSRDRFVQEEADDAIDEFYHQYISAVEALSIGRYSAQSDKFLKFLSGDGTHSNFYDRAAIHTSTFRKEVEGIAVAGVSVGISKTRLKGLWKEYRRHPFDNPVFREIAKKRHGKAEAIANNGIRSGGRLKPPSWVSLEMLGTLYIAKARAMQFYEECMNRGAISFHVRRGSPFPCLRCDGKSGERSQDDLPPYHANCRCVAVPVFTGNKEDNGK